MQLWSSWTVLTSTRMGELYNQDGMLQKSVGVAPLASAFTTLHRRAWEISLKIHNRVAGSHLSPFHPPVRANC